MWQAVDHVTREILAYVVSTREDSAVLHLLALLQPFGIQHFYIDGWGGYERHLDQKQHTVGKRYIQNTTVETFDLSHSDQTFGVEDNLFFAHLS